MKVLVESARVDAGSVCFGEPSDCPYFCASKCSTKAYRCHYPTVAGQVPQKYPKKDNLSAD